MNDLLSLNMHEAAFVQTFLPAERRERFQGALSHPRRRDVFRRHLYHPKDGFLISKYILQIKPAEQYATAIAQSLSKLGAPSACWVFGNKIDGKEMPLKDALEEIVGYRAGTIVSCIPGKLAFFESEEDRMLLYAPDAKPTNR